MNNDNLAVFYDKNDQKALEYCKRNDQFGKEDTLKRDTCITAKWIKVKTLWKTE